MPCAHCCSALMRQHEHNHVAFVQGTCSRGGRTTYHICNRQRPRHRRRTPTHAGHALEVTSPPQPPGLHSPSRQAGCVGFRLCFSPVAVIHAFERQVRSWGALRSTGYTVHTDRPVVARTVRRGPRPRTKQVRSGCRPLVSASGSVLFAGSLLATALLPAPSRD